MLKCLYKLQKFLTLNPNLSYREKLKQKKLQKIAKIREEIEAPDFDKLKDNIIFGEVAQAPPSLKTLPKARGGLKNQVCLLCANFTFFL
jgi:hypothetical protein